MWWRTTSRRPKLDHESPRILRSTCIRRAPWIHRSGLKKSSLIFYSSSTMCCRSIGVPEPPKTRTPLFYRGPRSSLHLGSPRPSFDFFLCQTPSSGSLVHTRTMTDSQERPWSSDPSAPKITHSLYFEEKVDFAGMAIASVLYGTCESPTCPSVHAQFVVRLILGILIALFFQCMAALFNPVNRRRQGIRWWLVSYTIAMFLVATTFTGMSLRLKSISYIDNRKFPGVEGAFPPGPLGYQLSTHSTVFCIIFGFLPILNYWLADGLLVGCLLDSSPAPPDA